MGHQQTRETPFEQGKPLSNKGNTNKQGKHLSSKENAFQTRETPFEQGKHLSSKETPFQTRKNTFRARETPFEQGKRLSSKGYLPIKCKSLQVVGVSRQGKAVVSDGRYGVIGSGYCLLVWGDAEETKGKRGRRWRGVGPAGRPFPILLWR